MATSAEHDGIVFQDSDLEIPFTSYNESMWDYFEPELSRRRGYQELNSFLRAFATGVQYINKVLCI